MRSLKAKLKKPSSNENKDDWSKLDQRIWHSVTANQPVKLASKFSKYPNIDVNKLCPSVGYSVVHYAAAKGLDDCLNVLLAHSANSSNRDVTGATPLHASARYGHKGTTSKLLATCSVDVNARDDNLCTSLHFAAFEGHLDCVQLIADRKECNIHCVDKDNRTPLMVGAAMGRYQVCQDLIKRGANVNHHDSSSLQHTALTLAAEAGHAEVVKLLCENAADYNAKLTDDRTALEIARSRSRKNVVDALHVIQLTQAAKKDSPGDVFDHDVNKAKHSKKKDKHVNHNEIKSTAQKRISDQESGSSKPEIQKLLPVDHDRKSSQKATADHQTSSVTLPLYNSSKQGHLYDRDVSLYDSKSTLASVSSLDVSSIIETNKSQSMDLSLSSQSRGNEHNAKLSEELSQKQDRINELEKSYRGLMSTSKMEIESLKKSNVKYEQSVQELEKDNDRLARDCMTLQREKSENVKKIEVLRKSSNELQSSAEEKILKMKENMKLTADKVKILTEEKNELTSLCKIEETKYETLLSQVKDLLFSSGFVLTDEDYSEPLQLLKAQLLQTEQNNAKKSEKHHKLNLQVEQLQNTAAQQIEVIQEQNTELLRLNENNKALKQENVHLIEAKSQLKKTLSDADARCKKLGGKVVHLQRDVESLKEKLDIENQNKFERKAFEKELELTASFSRKAFNDYNNERVQWEENKSSMQKNIEDLREKCVATEKEAVENEKEIGKLRAERNQREAVISKLEKDLKVIECRRKEIEVETNRTRQQLTESKQKCSNLESENAKLIKSKKEMMKKMQVLKFENNQIEKKKVDSVKTNLDNLIKHIEESEKKHNDTILAYRRLLLNAAKGDLDAEVLGPLKEIAKLIENKGSGR